MKKYLDKANFGQVYEFIDTPVWYSVEVDVDPALVEAARVLRLRYEALTHFLDRLYEARRAGAPLPELTDAIKEIIESCRAPAAAPPAKKQRKQDTVAASSTPSPAA